MRIENESLLRSFRGTRSCERCGRWRPCDAAHVFRRGLGGAYRLDIPANLCSICRICHDTLHAQPHDGRDVLIAIVAQRENYSPAEIAWAIPRIQEWPKGRPLPPELARFVPEESVVAA